MKTSTLCMIIFFSVPSSIIEASPIIDIIYRYDNGTPKVIHIFQEFGNNIILKEKRYYYQNGGIKAIGYISGLKAGKWEYFNEFGAIQNEQFDLDDMTLNDNSLDSQSINEVKDGQQVILKKIASLEQSIANLAVASKNKPAANKKQQPPPADPNKVYNIEIGDSFILGPKNAKVTIIEWMDFQ